MLETFRPDNPARLFSPSGCLQTQLLRGKNSSDVSFPLKTTRLACVCARVRVENNGFCFCLLHLSDHQ